MKRASSRHAVLAALSALFALAIGCAPPGEPPPRPPGSSASTGATEVPLEVRPGGPAGADEGPPVADFVDIAAEAGIDLVNVCGHPEGKATVILETLGQGAAMLDYDGDGLLDLYVVNGGSAQLSEVEGNRLYRNLGDLRFEDVTERAGVGDASWGVGTAVGDCDNDGDPDLVLTNHGENHLFVNRGDGTFEDVVLAPGRERSSTGAAFGDFDGDGLLDLYIANYSFNDIHEPGPREFWRGIEVVKGPRGLPPEPDEIYRNLGGCRFEERSEEWLPEVATSYGLGVLTFDYDYDGDTDLLVANDSTANFLLRNRGDGTFEDRALIEGFALSEDGRVQGCMGIDAADLDGDGRCDVAITNFSLDYHTVYVNESTGFYDRASHWGLPATTRPELGWGTILFDYDFDGDPDLFFANGHIYAGVEAVEYLTYPQYNQLYENSGGTLREVTGRAGSGLRVLRSSRGAVDGDLDNDGRREIFVINVRDTPTLLVDRMPRTNGWIGFELEGRVGNRDAIGALVRLQAGDLHQLREVRTSGSYLAGRDPRLVFGLGEAREVEEVTVRWPGGGFQAFGPLEAGAYYYLREGEEPVRREPAASPGS